MRKSLAEAESAQMSTEEKVSGLERQIEELGTASKGYQNQFAELQTRNKTLEGETDVANQERDEAKASNKVTVKKGVK